MRLDILFSASRQPPTFALLSWSSFNVQIYKAGNGCRWLESRLAIITEKNEQSALEGEPSPSAQHAPGVVSSEGPHVMCVSFTQLQKPWLTVGLRDQGQGCRSCLCVMHLFGQHHDSSLPACVAMYSGLKPKKQGFGIRSPVSVDNYL